MFANGGSVDGTIDGGGGTNTLDYGDQTEAVSANLSSGEASHTGGIAFIAQVYGGAGDDTLIGNAQGNVLRGRDGDDILRGGGGVDVFYGGAGNDTLIGEDTTNLWDIAGINSGVLNGLGFVDIENLIGGAGDDVFAMAPGGVLTGEVDGGEGTNTLDYQALSTGVIVSLAGGIALTRVAYAISAMSAAVPVTTP